MELLVFFIFLLWGVACFVFGFFVDNRAAFAALIKLHIKQADIIFDDAFMLGYEYGKTDGLKECLELIEEQQKKKQNDLSDNQK